ncbi:hypothetical protein [Nocardia sp. NBC_01327]|uniref:hypothetical protein n=1 Tax=Nocardia sp. NBC_01327 TaxID=2903593 RepID=UPI002E16869F|nr:hypothetical protein OG326_42030 [Nocardia sp. NBC_01327]
MAALGEEPAISEAVAKVGREIAGELSSLLDRAADSNRKFASAVTRKLRAELDARFAPAIDFSKRIDEFHRGAVEELRSSILHQLDGVATELGEDPMEFRNELVTRMKPLVIGKPIATRVRPETLLKILHDGRYKTNFEVSEHGGGADLTKRAKYEHLWFGCDPTTFPPEMRRVYGYVRVSGEYPAATGPYGIGGWMRTGPAPGRLRSATAICSAPTASGRWSGSQKLRRSPRSP